MFDEHWLGEVVSLFMLEGCTWGSKISDKEMILSDHNRKDVTLSIFKFYNCMPLLLTFVLCFYWFCYFFTKVWVNTERGAKIKIIRIDKMEMCRNCRKIHRIEIIVADRFLFLFNLWLGEVIVQYYWNWLWVTLKPEMFQFDTQPHISVLCPCFSVWTNFNCVWC